MPSIRSHRRSSARSRLAGATLLEMTVAAAIFVVVMLSGLSMIYQDKKFSRSTVQITAVEDQSQQMLFRLEHELASAFGEEPIAVLTTAVDAFESGALVVDSTLGFPPAGTLLVDRGTVSEERIDYGSLSNDQVSFVALGRGAQCTQGAAHTVQSELLWSGLAEPIALQTSPSSSDYDGIANEFGTPVYFRGDGIGFSYRVPVDPAGGTNYVNGEDLNWGAVVPTTGPTTDGWIALYYEPKGMYDESDTGDDINGDGDFIDVFDVGQIRRSIWDVTNPTGPVRDIGLGPTHVLQERCNWGGDLNGDGFDDPIFLWNPVTNELHVRLYLIGRTNREMPIVRSVESVMFLRNEPEIF